MSGLSVEQRLAEIAEARVRATIYEKPRSRSIAVWLPHNPPYRGECSELSGDDPNVLFTYTLETADDLRRHGIASRLKSAMGYAALQAGFATLRSAVESPHTIRLMEKVYGQEALSFYDLDPLRKTTELTTITAEQAAHSLERAIAVADESEEPSLIFTVDLSAIPPHTLEQPIITYR